MQARGLGVRLATPSPADAEAARGVRYRSRHRGFHKAEKEKMASISGESIFGAGKESSGQARRKAVLMKAAKLGIKTKGMRLLEHGASWVSSSPRSTDPRGAAEVETEGREPAKRSRQTKDEIRTGTIGAVRASVDGNAGDRRELESPNQGAAGLRSQQDDDGFGRPCARRKRKAPMTEGAVGRDDALVAIATMY